MKINNRSPSGVSSACKCLSFIVTGNTWHKKYVICSEGREDGTEGAEQPLTAGWELRNRQVGQVVFISCHFMPPLPGNRQQTLTIHLSPDDKVKVPRGKHFWEDTETSSLEPHLPLPGPLRIICPSVIPPSGNKNKMLKESDTFHSDQTLGKLHFQRAAEMQTRVTKLSRHLKMCYYPTGLL